MSYSAKPASNEGTGQQMKHAPSYAASQMRKNTPDAKREPLPTSRADLMIGLLVALIAFLARIRDIGAPSLWVDEAASLTFSKMSWSKLFTELPALETNPPLYYGLLKGWTSLAGTSEIALRLPGAIASTLSVYILFLIALKGYGRTAALVAAGFLAFSAVQISYAQEARVFPFVTLLFVIGLGAVQELILRLRDQRRTWGALLVVSVVTAGLPYLHYSGFFVAIILVSYMVLLLIFHGYLGAVAPRLGIVAVLALVLALVPVFWALSVMNHPDSPVGWLTAPSFWDAKYVFHQVFGYGYLPFGRPNWLPSSMGDTSATRLLATRRLAELLLFLICTIGVVISLRRKDWAILALVIAMGLVILVFFGVSQSKPVLIERTVIFAIPMLALITGYSVCALRWNLLVIPAAISVVAFQAMNLTAYYPKAEKEPWRELFSKAKMEYRDGNAVIFASGPYLSVTLSTAVLADYYWKSFPKQDGFSLRATLTGRLYELGMSLTPWVQDLNLEAACRQLGEATGMMVVYRHVSEAKDLAQTFSALESNRLARTELGGLGFELWSPPRCD